MRVDRVPQEIHIENHTTHYEVIILWGLLDTEYAPEQEFVSLKAAREYIEKRFGKNHSIPVLR